MGVTTVQLGGCRDPLVNRRIGHHSVQGMGIIPSQDTRDGMICSFVCRQCLCAGSRPPSRSDQRAISMFDCGGLGR